MRPQVLDSGDTVFVNLLLFTFRAFASSAAHPPKKGENKRMCCFVFFIIITAMHNNAGAFVKRRARASTSRCRTFDCDSSRGPTIGRRGSGFPRPWRFHIAARRARSKTTRRGSRGASGTKPTSSAVVTG